MRYLLFILPLLLFGCADSSTTGTSRTYDIQVNIHDNWGPVTLDFPLQVDAQSATEQVTENASDIAPDLRVQLTEGGATGSMAGADSVLKDITSKAKATIEKIAAEKVKESLPVAEPEPKPKPPVIEETTDTSQTFKTSGFANGRQGWRIPKCGKDYSVPIEFRFESGFTRIVDDLGKRIEDPNGFLVRPGTCKQEAGDPSQNQEWTSHGGMYVHAPFGDKSTELTLTTGARHGKEK